MTPEETLLANGFTLGLDKEWHKGDLSLYVSRSGSMACPHYESPGGRAQGFSPGVEASIISLTPYEA